METSVNLSFVWLNKRIKKKEKKRKETQRRQSEGHGTPLGYYMIAKESIVV